jgi:hypothetical protein
LKFAVEMTMGIRMRGFVQTRKISHAKPIAGFFLRLSRLFHFTTGYFGHWGLTGRGVSVADCRERRRFYLFA